VADLDDTAESGQSLLVDLFVGQQFRVIEKIPQEPAQLPHRFLRAVETTHDGLTGQGAGLENGESEDVERFMGVPAELGAINPNEEDAVGNLRTRIADRATEAGGRPLQIFRRSLQVLGELKNFTEWANTKFCSFQEKTVRDPQGDLTALFSSEDGFKSKLPQITLVACEDAFCYRSYSLYSLLWQSAIQRCNNGGFAGLTPLIIRLRSKAMWGRYNRK